MRLRVLILSSLLLLALGIRAFAQEGDEIEAEPVILSSEQSEYPLGLYLELLEDPGGDLTIEDVTSPEYAAQFTPSLEEVPNLGPTFSAYWLRLRLRNENPVPVRWLLESRFASLHFVDLYSPLADGDGFSVKQTGAMRPLSSRDIFHPNIVFDLTIPAQSEQTYYLRIKTGDSMTLPFTLYEPDTFFANSLRDQAMHGIFLGIMVSLLVYNLFLLVSLRDRSYLFLVLFLTGITLYDLSHSSFLEVYIAPNLYQLKQHTIVISIGVIFTAIILFNESFLSVKTLFPKMHLMNVALLIIWVVLTVSTFFFTYNDLVMVIPPTAVVTMVLNGVIVLVAWQRGFRTARFLVLAWSVLIVGLLAFVLTRMGFMPSNAVTENGYRVGFSWMAICWSLALADRVNLLKAETESAEHRLSQTLEAMPVGVVVYGNDQKPIILNKRSTEILSNPVQEIKPDVSAGRSLAEAANYFSFRIAGTDQAYPLEEMPVYRALHGETASIDDVEANLVDKRVPLEIWASPVLDNAGNVESAVVAFQDITVRKQAEMALRASEERFRVIVENNFEGIIFMDRDRKLVYVSPSYTNLNGMNTEELIGQSGAGFIHPDDQASVAEKFQKLLQQPGGRISAEYRIKHRDGSWVWIETNVLNLLDDAHVQAVVLNSRDITERKKTEAELADYRHHLEQLVQERTEELGAINEQLTGEMVERAVLEGLLQKRIQWMSTLALARQRIKGSTDLPSAYEHLSLEILQLLDAGSLFLIRWQQEEVEQIEFLCPPISQGPGFDPDAIRTSFEVDTVLRQGLEPGETVIMSADEVSSMPEPIRDCFVKSGKQSLLLAPIVSGEKVTGVLGMTLSLSKQEFSTAQREMVRKITLDLVNMAQEARYLDQTRALVATEERNRLARDLHDSVTQVLFSASLVAEVLPQIWQRNPDRVMESLEELRRLTRGALAEMRTMLLELRPAAVEKSPLPELLAQLTEASTSRVQLPFRLFIEQTQPLPGDVHAAVYRIAQEALNNVAKHARASEVTLSYRAMPLTAQKTEEKMVGVRLVVEDDGVGFSPEDEQVEHLGLGIMRERAADVGAELAIESRIGEGTRVILDWYGSLEDVKYKS